MAKVMVATSMGRATSAVPSLAACWGDFPMWAWRTTFSKTTIDWSTRIPMAKARPPSVIALIVSPVKYNPKIAARSASGMAKMTTKV